VIYFDNGVADVPLAPRYPDTSYEASPLVDLSAKAERERLSPSATGLSSTS
jgi:hypothetical protein